MATVTVESSDLEKICDALAQSRLFFERRDEMNAAVHLGGVRYSPLTSLVQAEHDRARRLVGDAALREMMRPAEEPRTPLLSEQQPPSHA